MQQKPGTLGVVERAPNDAEIDRANMFCHAFIRFIISEGLDPGDALLYVAAAASQVIKNVADGSGLGREDVLLMFAQNTMYFMECMKEGGTAYPIPRKDL